MMLDFTFKVGMLMFTFSILVLLNRIIVILEKLQ